MSDDTRIREIKDEDGELMMRVWEENAGTVLRALRWQSPAESRELLDYPEQWFKFSDRQLYKLCRGGSDVE